MLSIFFQQQGNKTGIGLQQRKQKKPETNLPIIRLDLVLNYETDVVKHTP